VGGSSLFRLENKNSIRLAACRMNLSVVPNVAEQEKHSVVEVVATVVVTVVAEVVTVGVEGREGISLPDIRRHNELRNL